MGMLIEGRWVSEADRFIEEGAFVREATTFGLDPDVGDIRALAAEPGRFRLIAPDCLAQLPVVAPDPPREGGQGT